MLSLLTLFEKLDVASVRFRNKAEPAVSLARELCDRYLADSEAVTSESRELITPARVKKLLEASGLMAERAASSRDAGWLKAGLTCHAIIGDRAGSVEHIQYLVLLYEAAKFIPCSFEATSLEVQARAGLEGRAVLTRFDQRDPDFNVLASFKLRAVVSEGNVLFEPA